MVVGLGILGLGCRFWGSVCRNQEYDDKRAEARVNWVGDRTLHSKP